MREKTMELQHHGRTMGVTYCLADAPGRRPAVIFSHGFNGRGEDMRNLALAAAQKGVHGVYFNFCGGSRIPNATFASTEMTWDTEKEDLEAVLDQVKAEEGVDRERIYLFGASHGGLISALLSEERGEDIRGLMLQYPAFCVADDWRKRFPRREDIPEVQDLWGLKLGRKYFTSIRDVDVFSLIGGYEKKVLIMQGDQDPVVPLPYARKAAERYPQAELVVFPGEGHGFGPEGEGKVKELVCRFAE